MPPLFSTPKSPAIPPPAAMPVPLQNNTLGQAQAQQAAASTMQTTGRASTLLTNNQAITDKLGG